MKAKPPTVDEIAAKHGWTNNPHKVKGEYRFKKGDLRIFLSKLGRGSVTVWWKKFSIIWDTRLKDGDQEYPVYDTPRDVFIDLLLRQVTLEEVLKRIEAKHVATIENARRVLDRANEDWDVFRNACEETQEKV